MCGIWASVGLSVTRERIDRIAHRGPDGEGWRTFSSPSGPVTLGHRRLAIVDTSDAGLQPMSDVSGRYWLVFNGEIYNYLELRQQLQQEGRTFRTRTDSEVLLQALAHWGESGLSKLRGMFAFALWDDVEKVLLVARDRFGIKPLYVTRAGGGVGFASEIKQLYDLPGLSRRMNLPRVLDFLQFGVLDHTAETMFADVDQLTGGTLLRIDTHHTGSLASVTPSAWYQHTSRDSGDISLADAATRFRELFSDSIRLHLRSDVTLGSCLSGGLDSSSIVAEASRQLGVGHPMTTVSAVFDEARVDERVYIDAVVAATKARPRTTTVHPDQVFEVAERVTWHQDEPFGSTSILAQWFVFEEARQANLKVMLDGQGADEPLAGYHWLFGPALAEHLQSFRLHDALLQLQDRRRRYRVPFNQQLREILPYFASAGALRAARRSKRSQGTGDWLASDLLKSVTAPNDPFAVGRDVKDGPLTHLMASMTARTSVPMLLHWEDRNSMAHSIEARVPFLDHPLIEFMLGLGTRHKIVGARTKTVLREAMKGVLPDMIYSRQDKLGFATPEKEWLLGPLAPRMRRSVHETLEQFPDLLDRNATIALVDATLSGQRPADFTLWRIASLGMWGRQFDRSL